MKKLIKVFICIIVSIAVVSGAFALYVSDYYRADYTALSNYKVDGALTVTTIDGNTVKTVYAPQKSDSLLIFYPGGKVEHTAYEPLMVACTAKGITCVLVEMPFNLAVFDINAADSVKEMFPDIEKCYIGGHSLGGSMAAAYLADNTSDFDGLILLGSYSTEDFSNSEIEVLSVYGSEDKVLNKEKYEESRANLPSDFEERIIDGGCHAYFGMYGTQDGDGTPTITNEEQLSVTADAIARFINK